jgi:hypothetical protein
MLRSSKKNEPSPWDNYDPVTYLSKDAIVRCMAVTNLPLMLWLLPGYLFSSAGIPAPCQAA